MKIRKSCDADWDKMIDLGCDTRFCTSCNKKVFDISKLEEAERLALYHQEKGKICARIEEPLMESNSILARWGLKLKPFRKLSKASLVALGLFMGGTSFAQDVKPNIYEYSQMETISESIIISGNVKGEKRIGWKKMDGIEVSLYTAEGDYLGDYYTDEKGDFIIEVDKAILGDKFGLLITSSNRRYRSIEVDLETKNTSFEILFIRNKPIRRVWTGRYF